MRNTVTELSAVGVVFQCGVERIFADASFADLCREAAAECANPELSAPAPDRELYRTLEQSGATRSFIALTAATMVGFALVLLSPSAHNGKRYATVESLFVSKAQRSSGAGSHIMAAVEDAARGAGCEAIFYSAHVGSALARLLFLQSDLYPLTNHIFCRRLK